MTHRLDVAASRDLAGRWCALAEQRLEYLTEMFESGRWRRYYSEVAFLENIKEAKFAVDIWRGLSTPHPARGVGAVELALSKPTLAQGIAAAELALADKSISAALHAAEPDQAPAPEPFELAAHDEMVADEETAPAEPPPPAPVIDMLALEQALDGPDRGFDITAIEHRYPLLRNTL